MKFWMFLFYVTCVFCEKKPSKGFFTISSSQVMQLKEEFPVLITSQGYTKSPKLSLSIIGLLENGKKFEKTKNVTLLNNRLQRIYFDMKNQELGNYYLQAVDTSDKSFNYSVPLHISTKKFSVFVQTDKAMYKPGDKVLFRVLLVDSQTRPYKCNSIKVHIKDGADNRIKQFEKSFLNKGVYKNELQLSDEPVQGTWSIHVEVDDSPETVKTFEVAEYVLPKFEVIVSSKPNVRLEEKIIISYSAKYTYGKDLENATATVTVSPLYYWSIDTEFSGGLHTLTRSEILKNGKGSIEVDIEKDLNIRRIYYQTEIFINVTIKDPLSGHEMSGSTFVTIRKQIYNLEFLTDQYEFRPSLPITLTIAGRDFDGNPVTDSNEPVIINATYTFNSYESDQSPSSEFIRPIWWWWRPHKTEVKKIVTYLSNGFASFTLVVPENVTSVSLVAGYKESETYHWLNSRVTASKQYIDAKVLTKSLSINNAVSIEITSTAPLKSVFYIVTARGKILLSSNLSGHKKKVLNFQFLPTLEMAPWASVLIYYVTLDGEIISDSLRLTFEQSLRNFVNLKLPEESLPGHQVNISVESKPNSYVGLLGVDQSVLLLKSGNDLDKNSIFNELANYGYFDRWNYYYLDNSFLSSYTDFWMSNLFIITNANKEYYPEPEPIPDGEQGAGTASFARPEFASTTPGSSEKSPEPAPAPSTAINVRKEFPETWLFDCIDNVQGLKNITRKVPDTITSWIISGFSLDSSFGLGLTASPSKLRVFQPFFVSLNLPYSVKRGEVVAIQVLVFNYQSTAQKADVTLHNNLQEFEFVDIGSSSKDSQKTLNASISPESGTSVSFMIRPTKVGHITLKVTATTGSAGDGVENPLLVLPEGVPQYVNKAVFIDLRSQTSFATNITIEIPPNAVPNSIRIEATAMGDILGPTIENLNNLIQMPYGCGEQNLLNFVPNIVVLDYLTSLGKLTPEIEAKCKGYMENGYQRELTYKHNDGSYSAFGNSDGNGSTWLTAFVLRSFNQASKFILIDQSSFTQSLSFLSNIQIEDGSFPEYGQVFHKSMQGGSSSGVAMTAYILVTFLEIQGSSKDHQKTIDKALAYVIANADKADLYTLAILTYALHIAKHPQKSIFMAKLDSKATKKNGMTYWEQAPPAAIQNPWDYFPNSINVEMTAYAVLAYVEAGREVDALPILRWLVSQRNENGGFHSTQDTVVGLQALSKLAAKIYVTSNNIEISLTYEDGSSSSLSLNNANALILQKILLSSTTRNIKISAKGKGFSVLQISYRYNINLVAAPPSFTVEPRVTAHPERKTFDLTVCTSFIPNNSTNSSNMAVMEAQLPSGYTFDSDSRAGILDTKNVAKVETKDSETLVLIYFNELNKDPICPVITAFRSYGVAEQKPASVAVYDYYDTTRRATVFYDAPPVSLCDVCEGRFCKKC